MPSDTTTDSSAPPYNIFTFFNSFFLLNFLILDIFSDSIDKFTTLCNDNMLLWNCSFSIIVDLLSFKGMFIRVFFYFLAEVKKVIFHL